MNKTTLHKARLIIPGILILLLIIPFFPNRNELLKNFVEAKLYIISFPFLIAVILGVFYYAFKMRDYFFRKPIEEIQNNIKSELLKPFINDRIISSKTEKLKEGRTLIQIFYGFVDNNKSLTQKAKEVYLNGLILSTLCDICAVCFLGTLLYVIIFIITLLIEFLIYSLVCITVLLITKFLLIKKIKNRHIELGNDQIEFIHTNLKKELLDKLKRTLH